MPGNSALFRSLSLLPAIAVASLSMPPAPVLAAMVTTGQVDRLAAGQDTGAGLVLYWGAILILLLIIPALVI